MRDLATRITEAASTLSPAARRVAEVVLTDPSTAAFATVAEVGERAGTSGATVVRLAERLGYDGWVDLQAQARALVDQQLRPAAQRIRETATGDVLAATATREADNVHRTLADVDRDDFDAAVALLADRRRPVRVLAGDAEAGIGSLLVDSLDLLRPDVLLVTGSPVSVTRRLATGTNDVVVAVDLRRYERWVLDAVRTATNAGADVIALTDRHLSPLAETAAAAFVVTAEGAGPFDSHVGTLALANALANAVAVKLRAPATRRIDTVDAAWREAAALTE